MKKAGRAYLHNWDTECANAKPNFGFWEIKIMDVDSHPISLEIDIVTGHSPHIKVWDALQKADTINRSKRRISNIRRPQDRRLYKFHTYTADYDNGKTRLRLQIVPHSSTSIYTLTETKIRHKELTMTMIVLQIGH